MLMCNVSAVLEGTLSRLYKYIIYSMSHHDQFFHTSTYDLIQRNYDELIFQAV